MKKIIFLTLLVVALLPNKSQAQSLPTSPKEVNSVLYGKLKVQREYWTNLRVIDSVNTKVYRANNKTISPELYFEIKEVNAKASVAQCKPCFLEVYDITGKIIRKSISYTDCPVGKEITYFSNGKIKSIGYWRDNIGATWRDFKCGLTGDWLYYNEDGKIVKIECHDNDKPY